MHHGHLLPHHAYLKNEIPVAGVRPPGRHVPLRHRSGNVGARTRDCRAHELDNLYVVDTSFFPSIGAVNPALTAMANALRVGDHLLERIGAAPQRSGARACRLTAPAASRRRVVIVGGGFGGMEAAKRLKKADVDVTVVDRHNHLLFQPLIYQVAAGALVLRRGRRADPRTCSSARRTRPR